MMVRFRVVGATSPADEGGAGGAASIIAGSGSLSQAARPKAPGFLARFFGAFRDAGAATSFGRLGETKIASAASNAWPEATPSAECVSAVGEADCRRGFRGLAAFCTRADRRLVGSGVSPEPDSESSRNERPAESSTTRLGRIRPFGADGAASGRDGSGSLDSNTASAARCVSRSNADRTGAVSNSRPFVVELDARLGCRRTSTVNDGVLRFNFALNGRPRLRRLNCPQTTLLGKAEESNIRLL
jgi:hypothetical protein